MCIPKNIAKLATIICTTMDLIISFISFLCLLLSMPGIHIAIVARDNVSDIALEINFPKTFLLNTLVTNWH